ncbi:hypothetical protein EST38_g2183 [Candolleomyces aberdarensis]|uniref:Uncharacterized protein n=1 Tax=Candolleomyces aberdarensis TaxID=2316362 RepID=A0A4V1Q4Y1_9AGAR|nr:hypothetical protein EST38_g2183 [Candolleomyces aberdarensis]
MFLKVKLQSPCFCPTSDPSELELELPFYSNFCGDSSCNTRCRLPASNLSWGLQEDPFAHPLPQTSEAQPAQTFARPFKLKRARHISEAQAWQSANTSSVINGLSSQEPLLPAQPLLKPPLSPLADPPVPLLKLKKVRHVLESRATSGNASRNTSLVLSNLTLVLPSFTHPSELRTTEGGRKQKFAAFAAPVHGAGCVDDYSVQQLDIDLKELGFTIEVLRMKYKRLLALHRALATENN